VRWRPARNLLFLSYALVFAAMASYFLPYTGVLSMVLGLVGVIACAADAVELRRLDRSVRISRRVPPVVGRGRAFRVEVTLAGHARYAVPLTIRDIVPSAAEPGAVIEPAVLYLGAEASFHYHLRIPTRGQHTFGSIHARLTGRLRMLELQLSRPAEATIRVMPETFAPDEALHRDALDEQRLLDEAVETRRRGEGTEFESLSEYREGDDPRRIDWRASARMHGLIVRRFQLEQHREVMILVDSGRLMAADAGEGTKLDRAIDAGLLLAKVALRKGDRCGFGVYDDQVRAYLPPISGKGAMGVILDVAYALQTNFRDSNFLQIFSMLQARQQKRALLVLLSDVIDRETNARMLAAIASLSKRHALLFVALRSPLLWEAVHEPAHTTEDAARMAVTLRLLQERDQMLHAIRRYGVQVLDLEPRQITVPLINHYRALRESSA